MGGLHFPSQAFIPFHALHRKQIPCQVSRGTPKLCARSHFGSAEPAIGHEIMHRSSSDLRIFSNQLREVRTPSTQTQLLKPIPKGTETDAEQLCGGRFVSTCLLQGLDQIVFLHLGE